MRDIELHPDDLRKLCDMDEGVLHPQIFTDERIYRLELDRIFGRAWMLLCPEQQIPNPGDYFNTYVGADRVIVVRQQDGSIKGLLNQCRHRGNELVRHDSGNAKMFTCSYHGWSFDQSGSLRSVSHEDIVFPDGFDKSAWGCAAMAQVETYKGLVFGTWDPTAPPLAEYLGDAAWYLDIVLDRFEGGLELMGGVNKWVIKANWKIIAEQFVSDMLHPETAHISAFLAVIPPDADMSKMQLPTTGRQFTAPQGHGLGLWTDGPILELTIGSNARKWFMEDSYPAAVQRVGKARADVQAAHMDVFPTCVAFVGFNHLRVIHPVGPHESEIWTWQLVPTGAPAELKKEWSDNVQRAFGAGGLFEADDSAVWAGVQRTMKGAMGRRFPLNVQMGDRENKGPDND
ncbi:aromatic ring-hydroxylating oxygenase subunit alpha, partial [Mycobacterium sp.]|uniref:aromatic ring-hydroxylating oxygenase subunit alpha n=1 Tax=Mycobacterium sp. TaxID=1785 RepID=UPI003C75ECB7